MAEQTTATVEAPPRVRPAPGKPKLLPPYAVILENDELHTYPYVMEMLQRVFGKSIEDAFLLTQQVDEEGEAQVWTGQKEVAEFKRDQVRGYGPDLYARKPVKFPLGVRIEPLPQ
jgi:ATP-dependent Clp protease adaptor protein ClpS